MPSQYSAASRAVGVVLVSVWVWVVIVVEEVLPLVVDLACFVPQMCSVAVVSMVGLLHGIGWGNSLM